MYKGGRRFLLRHFDGQDAGEHEPLRHHAFEFVVDQVNGVDLIGGVHVDGLAGDCGEAGLDHTGREADVLSGDGGAAFAEIIAGARTGGGSWEIR
jgi:hypothetical protein